MIKTDTRMMRYNQTASFFKNLSIEELYTLSIQKWQCIKRFYARRGFLHEYFSLFCSFCFNSRFIYKNCWIDHELCGNCLDEPSLYTKISFKNELDVNILPLLEYMVSMLKKKKEEEQ